VRSRLSEPIDFEVIWSSLPEPAMILDKKNQFLALNSAAELFLFSSQTSLIGKPLKTFTGDSSRLIDVIEQSRKNGSWLAEYGVELSWRDRPTSMVDLQAAPIHERPGEMLLLIHPRSIAEKMDRTLVHRGAARSVIGMAAMLAHEIKNPLAGIKGALEILREDTGEEFTESLCNEMLGELGRVNETLQALLTSARPSPPQLTTIDVADLLSEVHRLIEPGLRRRQIRLEIVTEGDALTARIDAAKIRQVLLNLIDNAAAEIEEGGTILVRAADFPEGGGVIIAVEDDGPGIPEDTLPQIFDPFFTTKFSGTGLGLAISQSLVEQHGGTLQVESEVGKGTTFFVILPEGGPNEDAVAAEPPAADAS
jgi:two-component system nitrogen regulation sensor histidine kinase GlnL